MNKCNFWSIGGAKLVPTLNQKLQQVSLSSCEFAVQTIPQIG